VRVRGAKMDQEEYEENFEFWNTYNWDWKSPSDVKRFVDDAMGFISGIS